MHQCATLELEDRLARVAGLLVLSARILDPLARERVLQFHRDHRDAVQTQYHIERLLGARRKVKLPSQPQAVRGVACFKFGVQFMRRLEERRMKRPAVAFEAVAQGRERAVLVHPLTQVAEDLLAGLLPVQCLQLGPLLRLRLADEGEHCLREYGTVTVEALARNRHVAILKQVRFDDGFERGFRMARVHGQNVHFSRRIMPRRLMQGSPRSRHTSGMK